MHTTRTHRSRKAISPILATLLLIVIAVAAIVVTYAWIMTYMGSTTQQASVLLTKANVNFQSSPTRKITVDIINTGTASTQIVSLYIGTSRGTEQNQTSTNPSLPITLAGNGKIVSISIDYNWTAGATYYFKVVSTAVGQAPEWPEQAPS